MTLELDIQRRLGRFHYSAALQARHEIVVLFGHSGAGKSLTLQFVAGLMRPDSGRIAIDGVEVYDSSRGLNVPPQLRGVGYVVQDLALFPHLSVEQNIRFGIPRAVDSEARVRQLVTLLHLEGFEGRKPATLSGGQQQRVALARALARDAHLVLLDEPFSALDDALRVDLRRELLRLREELGLTILFVTHDLREAHLLADRIAVFDEGSVLQFGPRDEIFRRPSSGRVAKLVGFTNIWPGVVRAISSSGIQVDVAGATFNAACPVMPPQLGANVDVMIRAERVNLRREHADRSGTNFVHGRSIEHFAYGNTHQLRFAPEGPGPVVNVEIAARPYEVLGVAERASWLIELPPEDLVVVPRE